MNEVKWITGTVPAGAWMSHSQLWLLEYCAELGLVLKDVNDEVMGEAEQGLL